MDNIACSCPTDICEHFPKGHGGGGVPQVTIEKSDQEKVRADRTKCDHVGYYVGHGFEIFPIADGSVVGVSAINCMMCGMVFHPQSMLVPPIKPPEKNKIIS